MKLDALLDELLMAISARPARLPYELEHLYKGVLAEIDGPRRLAELLKSSDSVTISRLVPLTILECVSPPDCPGQLSFGWKRIPGEILATIHEIASEGTERSAATLMLYDFASFDDEIPSFAMELTLDVLSHPEVRSEAEVFHALGIAMKRAPRDPMVAEVVLALARDPLLTGSNNALGSLQDFDAPGVEDALLEAVNGDDDNRRLLAVRAFVKRLKDGRTSPGLDSTLASTVQGIVLAAPDEMDGEMLEAMLTAITSLRTRELAYGVLMTWGARAQAAWRQELLLELARESANGASTKSLEARIRLALAEHR